MEDIFEIGIWPMPFVVPSVIFLLLAIQEAQGAAGVEKALTRHSKECRANISRKRSTNSYQSPSFCSTCVKDFLFCKGLLQRLCKTFAPCLFHITALFSVEPSSFAEAFHDLSGKGKSSAKSSSLLYQGQPRLISQ